MPTPHTAPTPVLSTMSEFCPQSVPLNVPTRSEKKLVILYWKRLQSALTLLAISSTRGYVQICFISIKTHTPSALSSIRSRWPIVPFREIHSCCLQVQQGEPRRLLCMKHHEPIGLAVSARHTFVLVALGVSRVVLYPCS